MKDQQKKTRSNDSILIVDDTPQNLNLLGEMLQKQGYQVRLSPNGKHALNSAEKRPPDLILLDINMPEMDGYEVCARLKENPELNEIPVLFISALSDVNDKVKAFSAGGQDYITKPFRVAEVEARVRTHLKIAQLKKQLADRNKALMEVARLREDVESIARHDLKTPVAAIMAYTQFLLLDDNLEDRQRDDIKKIAETGRTMLSMINRSLDLFKIERGLYKLKPVAFDALKIIANLVREQARVIDSRQLQVQVTPPGENETAFVWGEELLTYALLANLLENSLDASPRGESVHIDVQCNAEVRIAIRNQGAVPAEIRERFFDKFLTAGKAKGTGLGTYSAQLVARAQGGRVELDATDTETTVIVYLPVPEDSSNLP